jgi:hypothetical protein
MPDVSPEDHARLAEKGRRLYFNACGIDRQLTCAEGFATNQRLLGHFEVLADYLGFLRERFDELPVDDHDQRRARTRDLIDAIQRSIDGGSR